MDFEQIKESVLSRFKGEEGRRTLIALCVLVGVIVTVFLLGVPKKTVEESVPRNTHAEAEAPVSEDPVSGIESTAQWYVPERQEEFYEEEDFYALSDPDKMDPYAEKGNVVTRAKTSFEKMFGSSEEFYQSGEKEEEPKEERKETPVPAKGQSKARTSGSSSSRGVSSGSVASSSAPKTVPAPPQETAAGTETSSPASAPDVSGDVRRGMVGGVSGFGSVFNAEDYLDFPEESQSHPDGLYRVRFVKEGKVKSGERVYIRALEPINVGGVLIPKNTDLAATVQVGQRLSVTVTGVSMNGRVYPLNLVAYDSDGMAGLYVGDAGSDTGRQVGRRGIQMASGQLRSGVGRIAGDILSTGVMVAESAMGERSVKVGPGFEFYVKVPNK